MGTADGATDTSSATISTMIQTLIDKKWLERLESNLCYDKYGEKRPCPEGNGTVVWHQMLNIGKGYNLDEGTTPAASCISTRKVSATPTQRADLRVVTDFVNMTVSLPVVSEMAANLGYGAGLDRDYMIADQIGFGSAASTGVSDAASSFVPSCFTHGFPLFQGNSGLATWGAVGLTSYNVFSTQPTLAHIRKCVTHLRTLDAMPFEDGLYRGIIHPVVSDKLRQDTNFEDWLAHSQPDAMRKGKLGNVEGVAFEESSNALTSPLKASTWSGDTSAGWTIYGTLIFGRGAYGVTKLGGDAKISVITGADKADPLNSRTYVGYKYAIAAKVLNPSAGVILAFME